MQLVLAQIPPPSLALFSVYANSGTLTHPPHPL